jgi:inorganic pyrophosphatase
MTVLPAYRSDGSLNVVVESPRGSSVKFKYDADIDRIVLSRPLPAGLTYPHDWGFVPATRASDGDPLDVMIAWDGTSYPNVVVPCRTIGVLEVEQTNPRSRTRERNDRLVVLPIKAPRQDGVRTVFELSDRWRQELERFFVAAVAFEGKELKLLGWQGAIEADALVKQSVIVMTGEDARGSQLEGRAENRR